MGWDGGTFASYDQRHVDGYTPRPAGVFGDTVTTLSQNWQDAKSNSGHAVRQQHDVQHGHGFRQR